jgi:hypothetical protein
MVECGGHLLQVASVTFGFYLILLYFHCDFLLFLLLYLLVKIRNRVKTFFFFIVFYMNRQRACMKIKYIHALAMILSQIPKMNDDIQR